MTNSEQGKISPLQFAIVAAVLAVLLIVGFYIIVRRIAHNTPQTQPASTTDHKAQNQSSDKKKAEEDRKKQQEEAKRQQDAEKEKAERAAKAAEQKKKLEQSAVDAAQRQAQPSASTPQTSTGHTPSEVASTGPEDTLIAIIGIAALSYAGYSFIQSSRTLHSRRS